MSRHASRPLFPTFLLPSVPFRRRRRESSQSTGSQSTQSSNPSPPDSPTASTTPATPATTSSSQPSSSPYLGKHVSYLRCARCAVDLCLASAIVSRGFTGRWGRAYLVSAAGSVADPNVAPAAAAAGLLPNTHIHRPVPRQLVTGAHTVSDVSCAFCGSVLGWKYVAADEESQRYKVGKFILETKRVCVTADWESAGGGGAGATEPCLEDDGFDSQDEDECFDLFAGTWTPAAAADRRAARRWMGDGL